MDRSVRRAPNAWDRFYARHEAPWRGERQMADLVPLMRSPVLELGAGNGKTLRPLRRGGLEAVGLDISWHALRRLGGGILGDAARLPFIDDAFGTVLDLHCTGHLAPDARANALREALRVTGPGGTLVQERLGPDDLRAQGSSSRILEDGRRTCFLEPAALVRELEAAGWRRPQATTQVRHLRIRDQRVRREHVRVVAYST